MENVDHGVMFDYFNRRFADLRNRRNYEAKYFCFIYVSLYNIQFYRRKLNPKKADKGVKRAAKAPKSAVKDSAAAAATRQREDGHEDSEEAVSEDDRGSLSRTSLFRPE